MLQRWRRAWRAVCVAAGVVWCAGVLTACGGEADYAQSTPEDVFESARLMVEAGDHERLHELLWTEDPRERAVYLRLGRTLGALADLSEAVAERFPEEVEALREGRGDRGLLAGLLRGGRRGGGGGGRDRIEALVTSIAADPYGFLERSEGRLSVQTISNTQAAILWEGEPVLPPFGMLMVKKDERWYVLPPITNPLVARWRPASDEEYAILGYMCDVITNAATELAAEARRGESASLEALAESAGRKAFVPVTMCALAYSRAVDARRDASRGGE